MSDVKDTQQDALSIVNDPKNHISQEQAATTNGADNNGVSRRDLLKYSGVAAAALSVAGAAATGMATGRSADAYTGYGRQYLGKDQFFNREPFRAETAAMMERVGEVTRPDWYDNLFRRTNGLKAIIAKKEWTPAQGLETMPGYIGDFYKANPKSYENFLTLIENEAKYQAWLTSGGWDKQALNQAYIAANFISIKGRYGSSLPEEPGEVFAQTGQIQPPEKWDFRYVNPRNKKMEFKSPKHASELVKKITHMFGASFVGVTKFNPDYMFKNTMRGYPEEGMGYDKVPEHWKSVIVFGIPMEWDRTQTGGTFFTAGDGYLRTRVTAAVLEIFLQQLGYASRAQTPPYSYEIMLNPFMLEAGLGEYARGGFVMIPEVGGNYRSAAVITDIEFDYDKPININMASFCKKCKICADTCPSGAIETTDEPTKVVRGAKRWLLDQEKCFIGWRSTENKECGTCIGVCPFSRKNTWIHTISRELDARDSFGIVGSTLLSMQLNFFKYPTGEEFLGNHMGGPAKSYHDAPDWMRTEEWFSNVVQNWTYDGMH